MTVTTATPSRNSRLSYDRARLAACAQDIIAAGCKLGAQGLTPATSSNFSMRLDSSHAAVTVSGRDKGALTPDDIMVVDMGGKAVGSSARPSAETLLHTHIYQRFADANAVLHTHSRTQTVASRLFAPAGLNTNVARLRFGQRRFASRAAANASSIRAMLISGALATRD